MIRYKTRLIGVIFLLAGSCATQDNNNKNSQLQTKPGTSRNDPGLTEARRLSLLPPIQHQVPVKVQQTLPIAAASENAAESSSKSPREIQNLIVKILPKYVKDKEGWAADIQVPFTSLNIEPSVENLCSAIAVIEQESSFVANPRVANLPKIALNEIYARGAKIGIPNWAINSALSVRSKNGRTYLQRIKSAYTEGELSDIFEEMADSLPLGKSLLGSYNPIRTAGAMQVSVAFATTQLQKAPYPYPLGDDLRHELFTRRGGLYFGIAHLLDYKANYDAPIYRFADYNAGRYSSRNAAFQKALSSASGIPIVDDGDLLSYSGGEAKPSQTQAALLAIASNANLTPSAISDDLKKEKNFNFYQTPTYTNVFSLAERLQMKPLVRASIPQIDLRGPKIQRKLTTAWFADRVNVRMLGCILRQ